MDISGLSNDEYALMREREMKAYDERCAEQKMIREMKAKALEALRENDVLSKPQRKRDDVMEGLTAQIKKTKKKLKKLQKRQRKQDKKGVISAESYVSQNKALIEKVGEVMLDAVKDIYGKPCVIKPL